MTVMYNVLVRDDYALRRSGRAGCVLQEEGLNWIIDCAAACDALQPIGGEPRNVEGSERVFRAAWLPTSLRSIGADPSDESVRASEAWLFSITDLSRSAPPLATDVTGGMGTGMTPIRAQATNEATISSPGGYTSATRSPR